MDSSITINLPPLCLWSAKSSQTSQIQIIKNKRLMSLRLTPVKHFEGEKTPRNPNILHYLSDDLILNVKFSLFLSQRENKFLLACFTKPITEISVWCCITIPSIVPKRRI